MKYTLSLLFLFSIQIGFSQEYDTVFIEKENIDSNNETYKIGNVYLFNYEIIERGQKFKLLNNKGIGINRVFELVPYMADTVKIDQIHLIVSPVEAADRTNENQTQISYFEAPFFNSFSSTGVVDNDQNVWIHPIRNGFFNALETCPFPFVKLPLKVGATWNDAMIIGEGWGDEKWGTWEGKLLLNYDYTITEKVTLETDIGPVVCYVVESTAESTIGLTKLKSYFSKEYGFVRLEYDLINDLKVNLWIVDFKTGMEFNDTRTFFRTKEYIKQ
ncbi:MAG: hypothetical protein K8F54_06275 [Altibacter sp.]|uniref:hypothetical protein n=1 Tax=Altibacter sp. TaxID=2024823 RepID=UPI001D2893E2|nr:hypothetical protein [Altibacter sp.]MBZ0327194.1 hypothetical protein [Altibacter sp.]